MNTVLHSNEVLDGLNHVTFRVLDYWIRADAIRPSIASANGSGSRRLWSPLDRARLVALDELCVALDGIVPLSRGGVSMTILRCAWAELGAGDSFAYHRPPIDIYIPAITLEDTNA